MTRKGPRKAVDPDYWKGRVDVAREYLAAARQGAKLAEPGSSGNPIVSHAVLAAIAYADAATAFKARIVNQADHAIAARLLREGLGNALPVAQERALQRLIGAKDAAQYGARQLRMTEAEARLADLSAFAQFVEDLLRS